MFYRFLVNCYVCTPFYLKASSYHCHSHQKSLLFHIDQIQWRQEIFHNDKEEIWRPRSPSHSTGAPYFHGTSIDIPWKFWRCRDGFRVGFCHWSCKEHTYYGSHCWLFRRQSDGWIRYRPASQNKSHACGPSQGFLQKRTCYFTQNTPNNGFPVCSMSPPFQGHRLLQPHF